MNQKIQKVNVEVIDTVPYLMSMILGLVHEDNKARRVTLGLNAVNAVKELILIEQERFSAEINAKHRKYELTD